MSSTSTAPPTAQPIELAREAAFVVGSVSVQPALCEIQVPPDRSIRLQPRVMQVFVALARADGEVVSRDDLAASCWGGVSVGEDALHRCIARLRRLAEDENAGFTIETLPRVGYRLVRSDQTDGNTPIALPNRQPMETGAFHPISERWLQYWPWATVLAAASFLVAAAIWFDRSEAWTVERSEVLPPIGDMQRHPAFSRDGQTIAYSAGTDVYSRAIYLQRLDGGEPTRLTNVPGDATSPQWSPDGTQIAFAVYRSGEPCRIMMTSVPSGIPHEMARCRTKERTELSWSPIGDELYFADQTQGELSSRIMRLQLSTGLQSMVSNITSPGDEDAPHVSPDARWLSFSRQLNDLTQAIVVRNLKSGDERVLVSGAQYTGLSAWAETSKSLFVTTRQNSDFSILEVPIDKAAPVRVTSSPMFMERMAVGPHGLLAVEVHMNRSNLAYAPKSAGEEPTMIHPTKGWDSTPSFAASGSLAWISWGSGRSALWLKRNGKDPQKLFEFRACCEDRPRWSPDGEMLAFDSGDGGKLAIQLVNLDGSKVITIPFAGTELGTPAWSADGRSVIFPGLDAKGWRLWQTDVARPDKSIPIADGWISVQTRGQEQYGERFGVGGVWRIGAAPQRITERPSIDDPDRALHWLISGNEVLYVEDPTAKVFRIVAQPIAGGAQRMVSDAPHYGMHAGFDLDPRSGSLAYTEASWHSDIEILRLGH